MALKTVLKTKIKTNKRLYRIALNILAVVELTKVNFSIARLYGRVCLHQLRQKCSRSSQKNMRVVFHLSRTEASVPLFVESGLALILSTKGCSCLVVYDDGLLHHQDTNQMESVVSEKDFKWRASVSSWMLALMPLFAPYSKFLSSQDVASSRLLAKNLVETDDYMHESLDLWESVESSLIRYYQSASGYLENEADYPKLLQESVDDAVLTYTLAKRIEQSIQPDIVVSSHGVYTTWGPFSDYFRSKNCLTVSYGLGSISNGTLFMVKNGLASNRMDDHFFLNHHTEISLEKSQALIDAYFSKRHQGIACDLQSFELKKSTDSQHILTQLKAIQKSKKIYALFPNVLWDNSLSGLAHLFATPTEWILETVQYFIDQPDKLLVIKPHPAEYKFMATRVGIKQIIEDAFSRPIDAIENLFYIPHSAFLLSYELFPILSGGIVYNGTIGMEMLYHNLPVFVAGNAHYLDKPFTHFFSDKIAYFKAFDSPELVQYTLQKNKDMLIKYLACFFFGYEVPVALLKKEGWSLANTSLTFDELCKDEGLNFIADTILGKHTSFQEWALKALG